MVSSFSANDTSWIWRDAAKAASIFDGSVMHREFTKASSIAASTFGSDLVKGMNRALLDTSPFSAVVLDLDRRSRLFDSHASQIASMVNLTSLWKDSARFAALTPAWTTSLFDTAASASAKASSNLFGSGLFDAASDPIWKQMLGESTRLQGFAAANHWRPPETFAAATLLGETGTELDALGGLWTRLSREDRVLDALDDVVGAVASRGALGIDYEAVNAGAERLAFEISELDDDEIHAIEEATEEAADATHTAAPAIRDHAGILGLARFGRAHRNEISIISGFTVGLTYAVMQLGAGVTEPATYWDAAKWGSGAYIFVRTTLTR